MLKPNANRAGPQRVAETSLRLSLIGQPMLPSALKAWCGQPAALGKDSPEHESLAA